MRQVRMTARQAAVPLADPGGRHQLLGQPGFAGGVHHFTAELTAVTIVLDADATALRIGGPTAVVARARPNKTPTATPETFCLPHFTSPKASKPRTITSGNV